MPTPGPCSVGTTWESRNSPLFHRWGGAPPWNQRSSEGLPLSVLMEGRPGRPIGLQLRPSWGTVGPDEVRGSVARQRPDSCRLQVTAPRWPRRAGNMSHGNSASPPALGCPSHRAELGGIRRLLPSLPTTSTPGPHRRWCDRRGGPHCPVPAAAQPRATWLLSVTGASSRGAGGAHVLLSHSRDQGGGPRGNRRTERGTGSRCSSGSH